MSIADLNDFENNSLFQADLCIVGSGPAGLSIAREFAGTSTSVLVLESGGREEESATQALYEIDSAPPRQLNQSILRRRIVGGSSYIWTGRCAPFQTVDYEKRPWVPNSGWPQVQAQLEHWLERAGTILGLGPNCYDDGALWTHFKSPRPRPALDDESLEPMFWQFSKSPRNHKLSIDFGKDRLADCDAPNIRILLHANLTHINTNYAGTRFDCAEIRSLAGKRACVRTRALVLCCGGVENARLLLASNRVFPNGVGNEHDNVGRYLMDHSDSVVGVFDPEKAAPVRSRFGHYWLDNDRGRHVFLHGLALSPKLQQKEELLNCHAYVDAFDVSQEDPWHALDRVKSAIRTRGPVADLCRNTGTALLHSGQLLQGLYRRHVKHRPQLQNLTRVELHCILEQVPDRQSRVTLSEDREDALGMPLSKIDWKISDLERRTAKRMTQLVSDQFRRLGLPTPRTTPWLEDYNAWRFNCVEKAHPTGTTRISESPNDGVVDRNCQVHGIDGLFVSGSSVFPTSGASNPTLMIVATALRLANFLKTRPYLS
ncbi:MAG TPA: GMC family oxidoreductase [Bryobacteraceae bacterium]|jgi:choline dehydrogenase-like flavoprotein|nr:GMC family oxidoreductase [Bryobacteraceae bacterium]